MTFREGLSSVRQTPNSCGEYLFQRQGARLHAILHIDICTPCRKLHWVVAIQKDIISYSYHDWLCTILLNHRYLHCSGCGQPKWQTSCPPRIQRQYAAEERIWCWHVATRAARSWLKSVTLVQAWLQMLECVCGGGALSALLPSGGTVVLMMLTSLSMNWVMSSCAA